MLFRSDSVELAVKTAMQMVMVVVQIQQVMMDPVVQAGQMIINMED